MSSNPPAGRGAVGIVGAGRMGRALASRIGTERDLVVVSRRAGHFASPGGDDVSVRDDPSVLSGCALVLVAVPADNVPAALDWVRPHLVPGTLTLNLATELRTPGLDGSGLRLLGCKIVGQSGQIARGTPAALVVDGASDTELVVLAEMLSPVGAVVDGPESLAAKVNDLVARQVIVAERGLAAELDALGLPPEVRDAATSNLAGGIWQAVATGNTGPFLTKLVAELTGPS